MGRRSLPDFEQHLAAGRALFKRGAFASALREVSLAKQCDPAYPAVYRLMGLCYARQGRSEEACGALREALRLDPVDFVSRGTLAVLLSRGDEVDSAIEELDRGIAVLQEGAAAAHQEARAMVESGRLPAAQAMLRRAAWLRLGSAVLQYYLAEVFSDHCLLEMAFRDWELASVMSGERSG